MLSGKSHSLPFGLTRKAVPLAGFRACRTRFFSHHIHCRAHSLPRRFHRRGRSLNAWKWPNLARIVAAFPRLNDARVGDNASTLTITDCVPVDIHLVDIPVNRLVVIAFVLRVEYKNIGDYKGWCPNASRLALAPGPVDVVNLDRFHESAGGLLQRHLR